MKDSIRKYVNEGKFLMFRGAGRIRTGDRIVFVLEGTQKDEGIMRVWKVTDVTRQTPKPYQSNDDSDDLIIMERQGERITLSTAAITIGKGEEPDLAKYCGKAVGFERGDICEVYVRRMLSVPGGSNSGTISQQHPNGPVYGPVRPIKTVPQHIAFTDFLVELIKRSSELRKHQITLSLTFPPESAMAGRNRSLLTMEYHKGMERFLLRNRPRLFAMDCEEYEFEITYDNYVKHQFYKNAIIVDTTSNPDEWDVEIILYKGKVNPGSPPPQV